MESGFEPAGQAHRRRVGTGQQINQRFGCLQKGINGISQKMLTQQLRQLEQDGLISRKVFAEVPPKVEYSLTDLGRSLQPILESISTWGKGYLETKGTDSKDFIND